MRPTGHTTMKVDSTPLSTCRQYPEALRVANTLSSHTHSTHSVSDGSAFEMLRHQSLITIWVFTIWRFVLSYSVCQSYSFFIPPAMSTFFCGFFFDAFSLTNFLHQRQPYLVKNCFYLTTDTIYSKIVLRCDSVLIFCSSATIKQPGL